MRKEMEQAEEITRIYRDVIERSNITLGELIKEVKMQAKVLYPNAAMFVAIGEPFEGNSILYTVSDMGDKEVVVNALIEGMKTNEKTMRAIQSAYMYHLIETDPVRLSGAANAVRNAVIDFANYLGIDIGEAKKYVPKSSEKKSAPIVSMMELEQRITETEAELKRLKQMRQPANMKKYLEAEKKRLMRAGKWEEAKDKTKEIEAIEKAEQARKVRLENLAKGRKKAAENRERRKRQKEQAKHPQVQFGVLAAKKLKQMKRDKAERAKSKKKAQEGKTYNIKSTSTIFV